MNALEFNHAMIYSRDVTRALGFYRDLLGLTLLEEFRAGDRVVYARLKLPSGTSTIALHLLAPGETLSTGGVRLYFEIRSLDRFCKKLEAAGAKFSKPPAEMPWGWKHAARKLKANDQGEEREIPLADWIDIGVFDEKEKALFMERRKIDRTETELTVMVKGKPAKAGIDPWNKLIDRSPNDNVITASAAK